MSIGGASGEASTTRMVGSGTPATVGVASWANVTSAEAEVATTRARIRHSTARLLTSSRDTEFRSTRFIDRSSLGVDGGPSPGPYGLSAYLVPASRALWRRALYLAPQGSRASPESDAAGCSEARTRISGAA